MDDSWESSFISLCEDGDREQSITKQPLPSSQFAKAPRRNLLVLLIVLKFNFPTIFERALSVHSNLMLKSGNLGKFLLPNPVVENSPLGEKEILGAVQATVVWCQSSLTFEAERKKSKSVGIQTTKNKDGSGLVNVWTRVGCVVGGGRGV